MLGVVCEVLSTVDTSSGPGQEMESEVTVEARHISTLHFTSQACHVGYSQVHVCNQALSSQSALREHVLLCSGAPHFQLHARNLPSILIMLQSAGTPFVVLKNSIDRPTCSQLYLECRRNKIILMKLVTSKYKVQRAI